MNETNKGTLILVIVIISIPAFFFSMFIPVSIKMVKQAESKQVDFHHHNIGINDTVRIYFKGYLTEVLDSSEFLSVRQYSPGDNLTIVINHEKTTWVNYTSQPFKTFILPNENFTITLPDTYFPHHFNIFGIDIGAMSWIDPRLLDYYQRYQNV
jgi:hypothetical protein